MNAPSQLPLPLEPREGLSRVDFIASPVNARALALVESWPSWPVPAAAIYGPAGAGKSHLVAIWRKNSNAAVVSCAELPGHDLAERGAQPLVIEDVDQTPAGQDRDRALFAALERATVAAPALLTGREHPSAWTSSLPDLASRFSALVAFPVWAPDDDLLAALARKLFDDRQLPVPDAVIAQMLRALERTPASIRDFIALADMKALAAGRPVNVMLVRQLLAERD